jgi:hypothetical protein
MLISLSTQEKDTDITLTLSITDLESVGKVSNDNFYSDKSTWKNLSVEYINPTNNQIKLVPISYNGELSTIQKVIRFTSEWVGSNASFSKIVIYDKGNGHLILNRSDVPTPSNYDITFTP